MQVYFNGSTKAALLDRVLEQFQDVPAEDEINYTFSKKFEKNMDSLIRSTKEPASAPAVHPARTTLRRIILVAIIAALLATTAMAIPAIREGLIGFFLEEWGRSYAITFDPEQAASAPQTIQTCYKPSYMPNDFAVCVDETNLTVNSYWLENDSHERIYFTQMCIEDTSYENNWLLLNANNVERSKAVLDGYSVDVLTHDDYILYVWTDNAYLYILQTPSSMIITEAEKIICSVDTV